MAATVYPMAQKRTSQQTSGETPPNTIPVQPAIHTSHTARSRPVSTPVPLPFHEYMNEIEQSNYMRAYQQNAYYSQSPYAARHSSQDYRQRQSYYQYRKQNMFGPYLMLQTLGEGEFGKVKLGMHVETEQEVAIKLIRKESVDNSTRLSKVEREISVLRIVRHPYIVKLYDVLETEKYIGIILECASGGELFEYILARRYLKEHDACRLFAQLISGVHYLHQKHIVHRDLKLENLLLDRNRNVIITDFGFANQFSSAKDDLMATSCGSPCYAAPELVVSEGLYVGSAVDIWSCGVILYAMLCGYLPFDDDPANPDGDNINLLYKHILSTSLAFPDYVGANAQDLLVKMLVPDPNKRCDIKTIMNHPWLKEYRPLFAKTVRELEFEATTSADLTLSPVGAEAYRYAQQSLGLQEYASSRHTGLSDYDLGGDSTGQVADEFSGNEQRSSNEDERMEDAVVPTNQPVNENSNTESPKRKPEVRSANTTTPQHNQVVPIKTSKKSTDSPKHSRTQSATITENGKSIPQSPIPSASTNEKRGHRKGYSTEKFFSLLTGHGNSMTKSATSTTFGPLRRNNTMNLSPIPSSSKQSPNDRATQPTGHGRFGSTSIARGTGSILHAKFLSSISNSPSRRSVHYNSSADQASEGPTPGASMSTSIIPSNTLQQSPIPGTTLTVPQSKPLESQSTAVKGAVRGTRRKAMSLLVTPVTEETEKDDSYRWLGGIGGETGKRAIAFGRRVSVRGRTKSEKPYADSDKDSGTMEGIVEEHTAKNMQEREFPPSSPRVTGKKMMEWIKRKSNLRDFRSPISMSSSAFDNFGRPFGHTSMKSQPSQDGSNNSSWLPEEAKLRIYHGAVDQSALTSRSPNEVFNDVKQALQAMGIEAKRDSDYKIRCTRKKRKTKTTRPISAGVSLSNASADTLEVDSGMSLNIAEQKKRRVGGSIGIRNLLRRSGPHNHSTENIPVSEQTTATKDDDEQPSIKHSTASSVNSKNSSKVTNPIYGDPGMDSGDEIRFSVELCKMQNLPGLYIVDIRRMRGNVWGYKWVYHQLLETLDLYGKGGYIPALQTTVADETSSSKKSEYDIGLGSIAEIQV